MIVFQIQKEDKTISLKMIPDFDNYLAGSDGEIYTLLSPKGKFGPSIPKNKAKGVQGNGKYFTVTGLKIKPGKRKTKNVHVLVCSAFHGPKIGKLEVSHINGNSFDNRPENLMWETRSSNHKRKIEHKTDDCGVRNSRAKINSEQLLEIKELLRIGKLTHEEIGRKFGLGRVFITKINRGHRYKRT